MTEISSHSQYSHRTSPGRSTVPFRRHQSLPVHLRRRSSLWRRPLRKASTAPKATNHFSLRSNPYIGWFRHSPSASSDKSSVWCSEASYSKDVKTAPQPWKSSPYVGWFRHSPPSMWSTLSKQALVDYDLLEAISINAIEKRNEDEFVIHLRDLLSGQLRGGSGGGMQYHAHHSGTVHVLHKLASWFFTPFHELEQNLSPKTLKYDDDSSCHTAEEVDNDCEEEDDQLDDYDSICGSRQQTSPPNDYGVVSSQAQAYYDHQTTVNLLGLEDVSATASSRLDYVITQMDIVRMTRNAARHLDVDSIAKLPIMKYRSTKVASPTTAHASTVREGWSWMMVQGEANEEHEYQHYQSTLLSAAVTTSQPNETIVTSAHEDVCVICLECFDDGDSLRVLPCNHSFHVGCIDRWLSGSSSYEDCYTSGCPTCKICPDGSLPPWAFAQIGNALSRSMI
jgi:hypothetical protein